MANEYIARKKKVAVESEVGAEVQVEAGNSDIESS